MNGAFSLRLEKKTNKKDKNKVEDKPMTAFITKMFKKKIWTQNYYQMFQKLFVCLAERKIFHVFIETYMLFLYKSSLRYFILGYSKNNGKLYSDGKYVRQV